MTRRPLLVLPTSLTLLLGLALPAEAQPRDADVEVGRVRHVTAPIRDCEPWEPAPRGPAAWQQPSERCVPLAWREALPPHRLLDAHRRIRDAQAPAARLAVIDEVAREWRVTVEQVLTLAGALPTSAERLAALTRLHPATRDAGAFHRTYGLLSPEDRDVLHVRITRPLDAETARRQARLRRLAEEERALQRALGD
ncbi:MAG: hypothetical protein M9894_24700 [Planctomycetes bacterium]|nr:hypothetical protein [Planctomycetota bacterium]